LGRRVGEREDKDRKNGKSAEAKEQKTNVTKK
jgi:hypothetical protein